MQNKPLTLLFGNLAAVSAAAISVAFPGSAEAASFFKGLGDLPGGSYFSEALGVSSDGNTVVGYSSGSNGAEAFRWTESGGMVGLGDLPGGGFDSQALGVSGDGNTMVGYSSSSNGAEAFRWTESGGMVGLGDLPGGGFSSVAIGVSGNGHTVVGYGSGSNGTEAFRWTESGGMVGLGDLPGGVYSSVAWGVSGNGHTVVGASSGSTGTEAFVWDMENGMRSLAEALVNAGVANLNGWRLVNARSISADGKTIVGSGINPNGRTEAWIATLHDDIEPVPTPALLPGLIGMGVAALRKRKQEAKAEA